jgi:hypothetical protein
VGCKQHFREYHNLWRFKRNPGTFREGKSLRQCEKLQSIRCLRLLPWQL